MIALPPTALQVNGLAHHLVVDGSVPLLQVLRNDLGLNGPKYGCGLGQCGACMVLVDGAVVRSCAMPLAGVAGRAVTTLEGLGSLDRLQPVCPDKLHPVCPDKLHPVQQAFINTQAAQCGYCLNGMVMATVALLQQHAQPTDAQVRAALSHNLCRCGSHLEILQAVQLAAGLMAAAGGMAGTTFSTAPSA